MFGVEDELYGEIEKLDRQLTRTKKSLREALAIIYELENMDDVKAHSEANKFLLKHRYNHD